MSSRMEATKIKQQCEMLRRAESTREMMSGANWASLEFALEDLKERDAATLHLESEESSWLNTQALPSVPFPQSSTHSSNPSSNPSSSMEHEGSGDYCSQVESASYSTTSSSDHNGSGFTDGADDSSLSILRDGNVRAILKKVKVNEAVLNRAIETLGGGEKGLKSLMGYIIMWVKEQKGCKSSSLPTGSSSDQSQQQQNSMPFDFAKGVAAAAYGAVTSGQRLTPAGPVFEPMPHQRNDRFHPFGGLAEMPISANTTLGRAQEMHHLHRLKSADSMGTPGGAQQELHHLHRFKSRRLMMVEDASEAIYHQPTTTFMGIGGSMPMTTAVAMMPGQQYPFPKSEMGGTPGPALSMGPMMPQMKCEDGGMQQQLYCNMQAGLGLAYACGTNGGGNLVDNSPAATTRAARRNRMARQRQSMSHHARITSCANATATSGSGCGGSTQVGLQEMRGMRKTGSSQLGGQIAGGVNAERKVCNVDLL